MKLLILTLTGTVAVLFTEVSGFVDESLIVKICLECESKQVKDHAWGHGHDTALEEHEKCMKYLQSMVDSYVIDKANAAGQSRENWLKSNAKNVGSGYSIKVTGGPPKYISRYVQVSDSLVVPLSDSQINDQISELRGRLRIGQKA